MDALGYHEVFRSVPARTIEDDNRVAMRAQFGDVGEMLEDGTHGGSIDRRTNEVHGFTGGRANERVQVGPLVLAPRRTRRAHAHFGPHAAFRRDQPEPGFVFRPDFDFSTGVCSNDVVNTALKPPFLKAS